MPLCSVDVVANISFEAINVDDDSGNGDDGLGCVHFGSELSYQNDMHTNRPTDRPTNEINLIPDQNKLQCANVNL